MLTTLLIAILIVVLTGVVLADLLRRPEARAERMVVTMFGAFAASLVGQVIVNPGWLGHVLFLVGGACLLSAVDWAARGRFSHARSRT